MVSQMKILSNKGIQEGTLVISPFDLLTGYLYEAIAPVELSGIFFNEGSNAIVVNGNNLIINGEPNDSIAEIKADSLLDRYGLRESDRDLVLAALGLNNETKMAEIKNPNTLTLFKLALNYNDYDLFYIYKEDTNGGIGYDFYYWYLLKKLIRPDKCILVQTVSWQYKFNYFTLKQVLV